MVAALPGVQLDVRFECDSPELRVLECPRELRLRERPQENPSSGDAAPRAMTNTTDNNPQLERFLDIRVHLRSIVDRREWHDGSFKGMARWKLPHFTMGPRVARPRRSGVLVAIKPRYGAPGGRGLAGRIIVNLLTVPRFYDVALRDFGLLLGALTLARLAWSYDTPLKHDRS